MSKGWVFNSNVERKAKLENIEIEKARKSIGEVTHIVQFDEGEAMVGMDLIGEEMFPVEDDDDTIEDMIELWKEGRVSVSVALYETETE